MFGKLVEILAAFALIAFAYGQYHPEVVPHGVVLNIGPTDQLTKPVAALLGVGGAAVLLGAAVRAARPKRKKRASLASAGAQALSDPPGPSPEPATSEPATSEPVITPLVLAAEPALREVEPMPAVAPEPAVAVASEALPDPLPADEAPADEAAKPASRDPTFLKETEAGDKQRMLGHADEAMDHYASALSIARANRSAAPDDPAALGDLAAALTNVGDIHDEQGRLDSALDAHTESLELRRILAARAPADKASQRALSLSLERLADTREARGHRTRALDLYRESLPIAETLAAQYPDDPVLKKDLDVTRQNVAELEAKLA
jgi:tetratricopeptide (TPR) repeat protein